MLMTLTITAENAAEMVNVLQALQGAGIAPQVNLVAKDQFKELPEKPEPLDNDPPVQPRRRGRPPRDLGAQIGMEPIQPGKLEEPKRPLKIVPKEEPEPEKEISILDVRKALTEYLQANSEAEAAALLAKYGKTDRLSKLEPQYLAAVYKAATTPASDMNDAIPDLSA